MQNKISRLIKALVLTSTAFTAPLYAAESNDNKTNEETAVTEKEPVITNTKNQEDPTKIITKVGVGYNGELTFSGSLALSQSNKINGSVNSDGDEWTLGGSWLFSKGIVNFNLDVDSYRTSFSVGTFVPLSALGVDTGEWLLFPLAGLSSTQGERDQNNVKPDKTYGGYAGMFVLRPINDDFTIIGWGIGGLGSNDFSSIGVGGGISYKIDLHQSVNAVAFYSDDIYRTDTTYGLNYRFEFN
jgi:hypothetical protein